jgi:hypothetical protein
MMRARTSDELSKKPSCVFRYRIVSSIKEIPVGFVITLVTTRTSKKFIKRAVRIKFQGPSMYYLHF